MAFDLVIRGGTVADGTGGGLFEADVAVQDGKIVEVGKVAGAGREEIDARGLLVTPGFVDLHTHFDGQITWDTSLKPSAGHGVTSVVMGNCGVGFAPCRPDQRDVMVEVMEGVEDIPNIVMAEGLPWNWETFPQYLDAIEARQADVDFAAQVPHIPVRIFVMGDRGVRREPANMADIKQMAGIVKEGLEAGALGFTTSRTPQHRTAWGDVAPSTTASEAELLGIAMAMKEAGMGVFMSATDFGDADEGVSYEFEMLCRVAEASGRPLSFSLLQHQHYARSRRWYDIAEAAQRAIDRGLKLHAQVCGRPVGVIYGLELSSHPFIGTPSYKAIAHLPLAERVAAMRDAELKAKILSEDSVMLDARVLKLARSFHQMYRMSDPPNYAPPLEERVDRMAERMGVSPETVAYDILLEQDGHGLIYHPATNYRDGNLDTVLEMMRLPFTVMGVGDAGAHLGRICDSSYPTHLLTYWARDRKDFTIPEIVKKLTTDTASVMGLNDRGRIGPGYKADLNVIDYDNLTLRAPRPSFDLPAGGVRLSQHAEGYVATIVSGMATYRNSQPTGALPGRLIRGVQAAPA